MSRKHTERAMEQESLDPTHWKQRVQLVGVGPGDPAYVTVRVARIIAEADIVAGFATVLAVVDQLITGQRMVLTYHNQEAQLAELAQAHSKQRKRCVVCCYGDLNFSAQELIARVERHCGPTERTPGISSVQVACARAALAMEETLFLTFHTRDGIERARRELLIAARGTRHLIILPLPWSLMPPQVATLLLESGMPEEQPVSVYQRLTLPDESALHTTLQQLATMPQTFSDLSIVVVPRGISVAESEQCL